MKQNSLNTVMADAIDINRINKDKLIQCITSLTQEIEEVAELILYLQNQFEPKPIPQECNTEKYPNGKVTFYNFFTKVVHIEHDYLQKRWFQNQEDADEYAKSGSQKNYHWCQSGPYVIESCHTFRTTDTINLNHWLKECSK